VVSFYYCTEVSYSVHMLNEKQVRSIMQCHKTHLRCFLFIAKKLVIACIYIWTNKLDVMQCHETELMCFVFTAQRFVIACIYITRNKLDITRNKLDMSCNVSVHCMTSNLFLVMYMFQCIA